MILGAATAVVLGIVAPDRRHGAVALGVGLMLLNPLLALAAAGIVVGGRRVAAIRRHRRSTLDTEMDVLLALDLLALAVTAGLPFPAAVRIVMRWVGDGTRRRLGAALRRIDAGLSHAIEDGLLAEAFDAAERSEVTGASLSGTLTDLAGRAREEQAATARERLEKLPVKLLFPMAFLILPGFILVAVVPTIVSGLSRLTQ